MKKTIIFMLTMFSFVMLSAAWDAQKTDDFLKAMERAVDPDGVSKKIKSFEIMQECTALPVNIKMQSQLFYKLPGKMKNIITVPNIQTTTVYYDGKNGIKVDSLGGVSPLEGKVLEETKISVMEMNPTKSLRDIFDKIEIEDQMELRDGKKYIVVICSFKPEKGLFPKKYLVDPESKLIVYSIGKSSTEMGTIESVTRAIEFKKMHGVMMAVKVEQSMMGMKIAGSLKYFNINTEYPDSFFEYKE